ncbi:MULTISPECIES: heavy metal transporter [unclassified Streptomyces]|uniref:heavy metal transporter n=1 Tax=unclassified Streptomyces TaxID=2593676 RepID=UPI0022507541|nr:MULTISPECIES: heavy metal transporter [unclassified Streptomyces]MCX4988648.1 heavy metal transporter [Streptomyces sp. NBC_00568]MCX5006130.1 heavy metal transporter [Streptomyces sp. NBC_00638]
MPEPSPTPVRRRGRLLRFGGAFMVLLALAGYLGVQYLTGGTGAPRCKVVSGKGDGASYEFTPEQAVNAATISAVGTSRRMPERAVAIALATALQESGLRNIQHGDRDSLGLFQQRPSQGWGTTKQIMDPTYAAGIFYEHLAKVPGYSRLPLTVAAQRVQRSGYPQAYAKHEPDATLLAAALTGRAAATLTCEGRPDATPAGGAAPVRAALARDFGRDVLQEAGATVDAKGSSASPAPVAPASPKAVDRTVTVPVREDSTAGAGVVRRGWELAHWAVANSSALHIERVSYAGREWTAGTSEGSWHTADDKGGAAEGKAAAEVRIVTAQ